MDYKTFENYARQGNLIPVCREKLGDMETPVSVLSRFVNDENVFLLESVENSERFGRYSFIGVNPADVFTLQDKKALLNGKEIGIGLQPLRNILKQITVPEMPELPPLFGGAIGFIGYETVDLFEELPEPENKLSTPEAAMLLVDEMIVFDNLKHIMKLIVCVHTDKFDDLPGAYNYAQKKLDLLEEKISRSATYFPAGNGVLKRFTGNMSKEDFCDMVDKAKNAITAGEVIQIVLSQKFSTPLAVEPLQLYRALRAINPSPYTFFFKNQDHLLIGSSPETLVKLQNGIASVRPIAGTRKRGVTPAQDRLLADELLNDAKERAEHLMLVDLGRNDLGRIAKPGSVQVHDFMHIERYSHVMHLVSDVEASLDKGFDAFDLFKAAFPAGTLSGAPKVRAMELINQYEPEARGAYGGAVGYFSYSGDMDFAITIRTLEILNNIISVQAGAGIVFDSDPEKEYEETLNKAAAIFKAVRLAYNGLKPEEK